MRVLRVLAVGFAIVALWTGAARADCTSPPGEAAVIVYNDTHKTMQFCDGDRWISMLGGGGGGSGGGSDEAWEAMDLADTASFDGACEYRFRVGTSWIWPHTVMPDYLLFDASTASFKFGAIEKATKGQCWYRDDGNVTVTSGPPATVDEMARKCVPDAEPNAFAFDDETGAAFNTVVLSNIVTIEGINEVVPVTVSGDGSPEVSINGGAWGTGGTITAGQTLQVRLTSGNAWSVVRTATVTAGSVSEVWSVSTSAEDTTPDGFTLADANGVALSTLTTASAISISGINTPVAVSVTGADAEISIDGGAWVTTGTISEGQTLAVRLTSSAVFSTAVLATIDVGGVTDSWSVTTRAGNTCPLPWGGSIAHGASVTAYSQNSLACGQSCSSYDAVRTCNDGTLSNAGYNHGNCSVASCLAWTQYSTGSGYTGDTWCLGSSTSEPAGVACSSAGATCKAGCQSAGRGASVCEYYRCQ